MMLSAAVPVVFRLTAAKPAFPEVVGIERDTDENKNGEEKKVFHG